MKIMQVTVQVGRVETIATEVLVLTHCEGEPLAKQDAALLDRATLEVLTAAALALGLSAFGAARLDSTSGGTVGLFGSLSAAALSPGLLMSDQA